ncbi:MAG: hypothetical protein Q4B68_01600 [Bacteroidales bacterium]|nr:hypothetical protein [Bacteroidales bacterium]
MKKVFSIISILALMLAVASCGDDEGGKRGGDVVRSIKVINHVVETKAGEVKPLTASEIDYTLNRDNMTISLVIRVKLDGVNETTVKLNDIQMTENKGVCSFKTSASGIENLKGHLDFNEATLRLNYYINGTYRVIATTPEVYSTKCSTSCLYSDGKTSTSSGPMYQYVINPDDLSAKVVVMDLIDQQAKRQLLSIKSHTSAKVTVTPEGYVIEAEQLPTSTSYMLNGKVTTTVMYPIADLKATIDLENDKYDASMLLGSITLTASGSVNN